jgi:tetrahydromethanopterin S-methyltransferase subunit B
MAELYTNIKFINVKKTYYHHLEQHISLIDEYDQIMKKISSPKIPSASSWRVILRPKQSFKSILIEIDDISKSIKELEERVNKWDSKATEIYFDTNFPPSLDRPEMEVNYINQQMYLLDRINQLKRSMQTLYTSINIVIGDVNISRDNAINTRRYYLGIVIAIILFLIGIIVQFTNINLYF